MFDHQVFVNQLNELLDLLSEQLSETELEFLTSYIQSGEWYLSLETLCEILIENDVTLNPKSYKIVEELGLAINLEPPIWEMLKPQLMMGATHNCKNTEIKVLGCATQCPTYN